MVAEEIKRHRRGDVREDGKIFVGHDKRCPNGEYWTTQDVIDRNRESNRLAKARERLENPERVRQMLREWKRANPENMQGRQGKLWLKPENIDNILKFFV